MQKSFTILSIIAVIAVAMFLAMQPVAALAGKDLCGGTGGNGRIVSIGNNTFTLTQNNDSNLIVTLTSRATVETSSGRSNLSDLKIGDRVTLVGDAHQDGIFTADAIIVCNTTNDTTTSTNAPVMVRNAHPTEYKKISDVITVATILFFGLTWLAIAARLHIKKREGFMYMLLFTIFYIYVYKVLDITLIQFQSLLLIKHVVPDLMLQGQAVGKTMNLIPLATLTLEDVRTSLLNVLLMLPFGFGLPFITHFRMKKVIVIGALFSIAIELLQLLTGLTAEMTFRVADINDVLFNTAGVAVGYILFIGFVHGSRYLVRNRRISANPIVRYITLRPQINKNL